MIVSDAYGQKGRWINTLHDFSFKIIHKTGYRHTNVDALNQNSMDVVDKWQDLGFIMQQLGNQSLLNNLFMVETGVMGMGEALIHSNNELNHNIIQSIEIVNDVNESSKLKRIRVELWDARNHWQMVEEAQVFTNGDIDTRSFELDSDWEDAKNMEIWEDHMAMFVSKGNQLSKECGDAKKARVSNCVLHYYWNNDKLMFKDLVVLRPNECW